MPQSYNVPAHTIAISFMHHLQDVANYANDHPHQVPVILHDVFETPTGKIIVEQFEEATGLTFVRPNVATEAQE